jgi:hypothetical protein
MRSMNLRRKTPSPLATLANRAPCSGRQGPNQVRLLGNGRRLALLVLTESHCGPADQEADLGDCEWHGHLMPYPIPND